MLEFLQAGLDQSNAEGSSVGPLNVERLCNYICASSPASLAPCSRSPWTTTQARQETLKAEEEAEGEDEEAPSRAAPPPSRPSMFPVRSTASHSRPTSPAQPSPSQTHAAPAVVASTSNLNSHHPLAQPHSPSGPASFPHRHEPVASSSSAPPSPSHFRLDNSFSSSTSTANSSATLPHALSSPALANLANSSSPPSGSIIPSPLTRLQARREREHHGKDRKGKGNSAASNRDRERVSLSNVVNGMNPSTGEGILINDGGPIGALKRRWTNTSPALSNVHTTAVQLDQDGDAVYSDAGAEEGNVVFDFGPTVEGVFGGDDQTMEEVMEVLPKRRKL